MIQSTECTASFPRVAPTSATRDSVARRFVYQAGSIRQVGRARGAQNALCRLPRSVTPGNRYTIKCWHTTSCWQLGSRLPLPEAPPPDVHLQMTDSNPVTRKATECEPVLGRCTHFDDKNLGSGAGTRIRDLMVMRRSRHVGRGAVRASEVHVDGGISNRKAVACGPV